jgi:hypothetical protein
MIIGNYSHVLADELLDALFFAVTEQRTQLQCLAHTRRSTSPRGLSALPRVALFGRARGESDLLVLPLLFDLTRQDQHDRQTGQILQYLLISLGTPSNSHLYCAVSSCLAAVSRVILFLALFACRSDRRPLLHQFNNCTPNRYSPARNIYSHVFHLHN